MSWGERSRRTNVLSYSGLILYPASFNKMESHELRIIEVGRLSILVHKNKIVNPLAEKFANKYQPLSSKAVKSALLYYRNLRVTTRNVPNSIIY